MPTLWLRLSEETALPSRLSSEERARLEAIFSNEPGSLWRRALGILSLRAETGARWLRWQREAAYFNWSAHVGAVSAGCLEVIETAEPEGWTTRTRLKLPRLFALLRSQWKTTQYLAQRLDAPEPSGEEAVLESLTLGLAIQSLLLRLPARSPKDLARWLDDPGRAPPRARATLRQIRRAQERRTHLSDAWRRLFPPRADGETDETPLSFWGDRALEAVSAEAPAALAGAPAESRAWEALPVHAGRVTGNAFVVPRGADPASLPPLPERPRVLVFAQARPEATELFGEADGLVFAEGGALSHACTVARERGIPCVTGVGKPFLKELQLRLASGPILLEIDGAEGRVQWIIVPIRAGWK